jgi:hypothetical protein
MFPVELNPWKIGFAWIPLEVSLAVISIALFH